jgi:hypothetical protein
MFFDLFNKGDKKGASELKIEALKFRRSDSTRDALTCLPASLTSLIITGFFPDRSPNDSPAIVFPKSLVELALGGLSFTDEDSASLPKGLKSLSLTAADTITSETLSNLPEGLESLDLQVVYYLSNEDFKLLPKSLKHLKLRVGSDEATEELVSHLPSCLESLDIGFVRHPWYHTGFEGKYLRDLPSGLLKFSTPLLVEPEKEDIVLLPVGLKEFYIGTEHFPDSLAQYLPRKLESLTILNESNMYENTDAMIADLPRGLSKFSYLGPTRTRFTKTCVPDLPVGLGKWIFE